MKIVQVLGTGCPKCKQLTERTETAIHELGIDASVEKVTDIDRILGYGVMMTPALVIDGVVKMSGKLPAVDEIKTLLA